jgi:hypothetical protein
VGAALPALPPRLARVVARLSAVDTLRLMILEVTPEHPLARHIMSFIREQRQLVASLYQSLTGKPVPA